MTTEIINRWSQIRNLSIPDAMLELRYLGDILATNRKASAPTETNVLPANSLPQNELIENERDENQLVLAI